MSKDIERAQGRLTEVGDWLRGRSVHDCETAADHAKRLAEWYEEDVMRLLSLLDDTPIATESGVKARPDDPKLCARCLKYSGFPDCGDCLRIRGVAR